jgi:hypothetical protein
MLTFDEVKTRWSVWAKLPFPSVKIDAIEGVDLISLDYSAAGCVDTFVFNRGKLDWDRIKYLRRASNELARVVRRLEGPQRDYFKELNELTQAVLEHVDL